MKRFPLYTASVALLLFCACSNDNDALPGDDRGNTAPAALRIEVSASDFTPADGGTNTRATDIGAATTFESGDRIGIIVLDNSNNALSDNIPYIYNGNTWSFDNSNGEGKTAVYYDSKAVTYLAYFPYNVGANGVTSFDNLKVKFPPQPDQRTEDAYRASDLLVWSSETNSAPLKNLEIEFTHAYSSLSLPSVDITCEITGVEGTTTYSSSSIGDVNFTINGNPYFAYKASDGSYRFITVLPSLTANDRYFFTYGTKTYSSTMSAISFAANTRYTLVPSLNFGHYSLNNAKIGDFYCKSSDGSTGYLIPGDIPSLTDAQQQACIGIVFKAGAAEGDASSNYDGKLTNGIHGYVVALTDALTYAGEWGARDTDENNEFLPNASSNTDTKYNGYAQTKYILDAHSTDLTRYEAFSAVKNYATAAPNNSSGWYLPSMKQLSDVWQLYRGVGGNVLYDRLNGISSDNLFQTGNTGGNHNKDNQYRYWTSTERSSTDAWYVVFDTGGRIDAYAKDNGYDKLCRARAILTF